MPQIESREREFYSHILRNRVDPAAGGSANNPVPDFYGMFSFFLSKDRTTIADAADALRGEDWQHEPVQAVAAGPEHVPKEGALGGRVVRSFVVHYTNTILFLTQS